MPNVKLSQGGTLYYDQVGSGPPLVLVHGSPGDGRAWMRVVKYLPPNMCVLTPDLPGYGRSDPLPHDTIQRTRGMAAGIEELVEDCAEPVWLCGYSYGGNVALDAALSQHDRARGLLLIEPVFMRALELVGERQLFAEAHAYFATYLARVELAEPDAIALMVDFWFGTGAYAKLRPSVRQFLDGAARLNALDVRGVFTEIISTSQLKSFLRPVLIVHGSASQPLARAIATSLAKLLPQVQVESIPSATHAMLDDHPEEVAEVINRWCSGH